MINFLVLYIVFGVMTVAIVSLVARTLETRVLSKFEIVFVLLFWWVFLPLSIVRMNR